MQFILDVVTVEFDLTQPVPVYLGVDPLKATNWVAPSQTALETWHPLPICEINFSVKTHEGLGYFKFWKSVKVYAKTILVLSTRNFPPTTTHVGNNHFFENVYTQLMEHILGAKSIS